MAQKITKKSEDFSRWYTDVVIQAELADYSPVKGCMVIRPYGYAIWELMQKSLDEMIKTTGHQNAYFPLFIPESFFTREAEHVKGFAPQCAVVTHGGGKKLEENLMIRPTSETIIYSMFAKWIQSYRDLPLLINQWANIVRWEMRTRLFLRTTEFLWQEGHTAHATENEADEEARKMLDVYATFAENYMSLPVIKGLKTEKEKFAGALKTYCIESMMGDGKALQTGTSHHLGQNFAKVFNVRFQNKDGVLEHVWQTSWGVSTRLIGALIMAHGDDRGLVLPPRLAPIQVVVIPIWSKQEEKSIIIEKAFQLVETFPKEWRVKVDDREQFTPGWKFSQYELMGVPLRIEIGPRDVKEKRVVVVRRDTLQKETVTWEHIRDVIDSLITRVQQDIYTDTLKFREDHSVTLSRYADFKNLLEKEDKFVYSHWCGDQRCEDVIQEETKATICVVPFTNNSSSPGQCLYCGSPSNTKVIFARTY